MDKVKGFADWCGLGVGVGVGCEMDLILWYYRTSFSKLK